MYEPRVTSILKAADLINFDMVPQDIMKRAQDFGSAVHKVTELDDLGTLDIDTVSEPILPYLAGWRKFCKDYRLIFTEDEIEQRLTSDKMKFSGMPDRISKKIGLLVDIKSSSSMLPAVAIQCAGYSILSEENGTKIKKRLGVQLKSNGLYAIKEYKNSSDKTVFLSCLNVYRWKKEYNLLDKK